MVTRDGNSGSGVGSPRAWRWVFGGAIVVAAFVWWVLPAPTGVVEAWYSRGIYPAVAGFLFSLADRWGASIGGPVLGVVFVLVAAASLRPLLRRDPWSVRLRAAGSRFVVAAAGLYLAFVAVWGANYSRSDVETILELGDDPVTGDDVERLFSELARRIERDAPREDVPHVPRARAALSSGLDEFLSSVLGPGSVRVPARIKRSIPGLFLSFGTRGMLLPVFNEAVVDGALDATAFLGVGAHELAHSAGFAGEADADVIGVLGGLHSRDAFARYCVALFAVERVAAALPDDVVGERIAALPSVARRDLATWVETGRAYRREALRVVQRTAHDAFLRSQGVEEGIADYSRSVELLVRAFRRGWLPSD